MHRIFFESTKYETSVMRVQSMHMNTHLVDSITTPVGHGQKRQNLNAMTAALLEKFQNLVLSEDSPSPQALAVLSDLKIATLQFKQVFSGSHSPEANSERKIVLGMLENAILLATKIGDWHDETSLFANAYAQLRSIYIDRSWRARPL